jgi:hypothetical protein
VSFVFFRSSITAFETVTPLMFGVGVVALEGLDLLDRGDTALETALGEGAELEEAIESLGVEAFVAGYPKLKLAGTSTQPQVGNGGNPVGTGATRLEKDSGFFMCFGTGFLSICFTASKMVAGFGGGGCALGTLSSA